MKTNKLFAKAIALADLLSYQDDAVVSQEVLKKSTGTITLFAFEKGQGLSEHTAPFDAFVYVFDGEGTVTIDGKANILKTGNMIIMPARKPHALFADKKFKMLLVLIKT